MLQPLLRVGGSSAEQQTSEAGRSREDCWSLFTGGRGLLLLLLLLLQRLSPVWDVGERHFHISRVPQLARGRDFGERDSQTGLGHPKKRVLRIVDICRSASIESVSVAFVVPVDAGVVLVEGMVAGAEIAGSLAALCGTLSLEQPLHLCPAETGSIFGFIAC